jgi:DNA-binding MarR family transcriptional regulator
MPQQHDGRRGEGYVRKRARLFADRFPWADIKALEITNALNACYNGQRAALGKTYEDLGFGKALGRSSLIHALYLADRPLTHNEIALELEVTQGTVTFLVDGLEKEGFVKRTSDAEDKRTVYVELTEKGMLLGSKITPAVARLAAQLCSEFTEEEKAVFVDLMVRFLRAARSIYVLNEDSPAQELARN